MHDELLKMLPGIQEKSQANLEKDGGLLPCLFLHTRSQGIGILGIKDMDDNAKEAISSMLRKLIAANELLEFMFLSEAWIVEGNYQLSEILAWKATHGTLKGFPGYQEAICISYGSPTKEIAARAVFTRQEDKIHVNPWRQTQGSPEDEVMSSVIDARFTGLWRVMCGAN